MFPDLNQSIYHLETTPRISLVPGGVPARPGSRLQESVQKMTEVEKLSERIITLETQLALYREQHESVSNALARLQEEHDLRQKENQGWVTTYLQLLSEIEALKVELSRLGPGSEYDSRKFSVSYSN